MDLAALTIEELLEHAGAPLIENSHLVYSSGEHGEKYRNLRPLGEKKNLEILQEVAFRLLFAALNEGHRNLDFSRPIVVVGPMTLGADLARLSVETYQKRHPDSRLDLSWGYFDAEKIDGEKNFSWGDVGGMRLLKPTGVHSEAQVIWVDDLMNRSSTLGRTRALIEDIIPDAIKVVAVVFDRSGFDEVFLKVPEFVYLTGTLMNSYPAEECPFCALKKPIFTGLGHGKDYRDAHPNYIGGYVD